MRSRAFPWFSDDPRRARPLVPGPVERITFVPLPKQPPIDTLFGFPLVYGDLIDRETGRPPLEGVTFQPVRFPEPTPGKEAAFARGFEE